MTVLCFKDPLFSLLHTPLSSFIYIYHQFFHIFFYSLSLTLTHSDIVSAFTILSCHFHSDFTTLSTSFQHHFSNLIHLTSLPIMGKDWYWGARKSSKKTTPQTDIPPGCMCALFQTFDFHPFHFSINQPQHHSPINSISKEPQAPRNSLESQEEENFKIPVSFSPIFLPLVMFFFVCYF